MTEAASRAAITAPTPAAAAGLADGLVDQLISSESLTGDWCATFRAVPRHLFVPDLVWRHRTQHRDPEPIHRAEQPEAWPRAVYRDEFLLTQLNDGATPAGAALGPISDVDYTSSTSMPSVMAKMLAAARVAAGMRILEIGTRTGWNTALLAHRRLGAGNVTSIEIDPATSARARAALADAGYGAVMVRTGDGTLGHPGRAPYDRVLSTAAVYRRAAVVHRRGQGWSAADRAGLGSVLWRAGRLPRRRTTTLLEHRPGLRRAQGTAPGSRAVGRGAG